MNASKQSLNQSLILLIENLLEPKDVVPCFQGNLADSLLHFAFEQRPNLANFIGELHERKITRFSELDRELIIRNRQRLAYKLHESRPPIFGGASRGSETGVLLGELGRKRGHMPIRQLMIHAGRLIQKIKPCFMMSPLSIAQFFDPRSVSFDVIIFDEASQVKPEDALGALLRGGQVIVMGDTRQLPPTTFFDHIIAGEDGGEELHPEATVSQIESILHQCRRSFPTKTLSWHYRSKHKSLIAVSNREFYDNKLLIFPSATDKAEDLGLQFIHLPDAVYDRGKSRTDRIEARAVAKAAIEHYQKYPGKSLGVGAFNIQQQQAILEEIELQLRLNPDMEDFFRSDREEHFFVKNLETIQGDERDVIFVSVGYGFDETKKLTLNFGPLNQDGGERRLNVLITRARERCVVFSNFRSSDLQIEANVPFGVRALKSFLSFAEKREVIGFEPTERETESPFEDSVYDFLRSHGFEVRKQVGCASFRVDLGIVDPKSPGRYLVGIECDGAKYHTSPVARDRDRLRQQILEGLGWHIHRVWSTGWYRNSSETKQRLLDALAREKRGLGVPSVRTSASMPEKKGPVDSNGESGLSASQPPTSSVTLESLASPYEVCSSLQRLRHGDLRTLPRPELAKAVVHVVEVEGPIHFDEVVRRIRMLWGLGRAGKRIHHSINSAASFAVRIGEVRKSGHFLWPAADRPIRVRYRLEDPPPRIELICDEEIAEAIKIVLKHQFATLPDDLISQACRLLGIQAVHDKTRDRIRHVLDRLIPAGELQQMANGMIDLVKS